MAINVGLVGLGGMGGVHLGAYANMSTAEVIAVCDVQEDKCREGWSKFSDEVGASSAKADVIFYQQYEDMFENPDIDVVDITLPTYLHADAAIAALKAGKHVITEKPMAIDAESAQKMIDAATKYKKKLFVAQCIRFWPAYAKAKEIIDTGKYGEVISAVFRRIGDSPKWSWEDWMQDDAKSGLCPLDLHIHDADFILHTFGKPKSVQAVGSGIKKGRVDHIITSYEYKENQLIAAEGAWDAVKFEMTFEIALEKANLKMTSDTSLYIHTPNGKTQQAELSPEGGHELELRHFIDCVKENKHSDVVTPASAMESVRLIKAERESVATGRRVAFK